MRKAYICGAISNEPHYKEKFGKAAEYLYSKGYIPLNPAILPQGMSQADYMRICLAMLDTADCVFVLPNWECSAGAKLEVDYCLKVNKPYRVLTLPWEMQREGTDNE